ncbi:hypothetical protein Adt_16108 [Abeliophyllum distichum]|uniref:Uncharacterized protein n=1 Tax=Abeliophyllum distichum TaxID=126358 RepID=A0ABD1TCP9_9LAMI
MGEIAVLQPQDILKNQPNRRHRNNLIKPPLRSKIPIKNLAGSVPAKVSRRKRRSAKNLVVPTSAGLLGPLPKKLSKQKETDRGTRSLKRSRLISSRQRHLRHGRTAAAAAAGAD